MLAHQRRDFRHHRRDHHRIGLEDLGHRSHDRGDARLIALLAQSPRCNLVDVSVGRHQPHPDRLEGAGRRACIERFCRRARRILRRLAQPGLERPVVRNRERFPGEWMDAMEKIAERVAEIGAIPPEHIVDRKVSVLTERDRAHQAIANDIDPDRRRHRFGKRHRAYRVSQRFAHLVAAIGEEAMREHLARQLVVRETRRHQERWPINRVKPQDVFAHDVHTRRPVFCLRFRILERRPIVRERIEPHVHDVLRVARNGYAPIERRA